MLTPGKLKEDTMKAAVMKYVEKYADEVSAFTKVTTHLADKMYVTGYGGNAAWM